MKKISGSCFAGLLFICSSCKSTNDFYQGKVVDEHDRPVEQVVVKEAHGLNSTTTDKNGYFRLAKMPLALDDLVFARNGYRTDTIASVSHQAGETTEYHFITKDTTIVSLKSNLEVPDLIVTDAALGNREIPGIWNSLGAIQKEWIKIEQDEKGYLIYEPCDGATPSIKFEKGYLLIQWQLEPSYKFSYDKFTRITVNKAFRLDAYDEHARQSFEVTARIMDSRNGLVQWKFNDEVWVMTPVENAGNFRHIKNNCPDHKKSEVVFKPIGFK